ncbi:MAG: galactokinase [Bacteroidia bacterium]|nr:galactokinase [Bacteroidia bacterium]
MNLEETDNKENMLQQAGALFLRRFGRQPAHISLAPGRINLIGEHTDYNGGLSLPSAINRWIATAMAPRKDRMVIIRSENFDQELAFSLNDNLKPRRHWEKYVLGILEVFAHIGNEDMGFDALIVGNVPLGAGLSSSAALEISLLNSLQYHYQAELTKMKVCKMCQTVEIYKLGLRSGLLDQWASQLSHKESALFIDFFQGKIEPVALPAGEISWVVVHSGVERKLAGSRYMDRVEETLMGLNELKLRLPGTSHLRDISLEQLETIRTQAVWKSRVRHFITENERVIEFRKSLTQSDFRRAGELMLSSHDSLKEDYQVSCAELDFLVEAAQTVEGCLGSRMMGGGFGGCTLNLVQNEKTGEFTKGITRLFQEKFSKNPKIFKFFPESGAQVFPFQD